MKPSDLYSMVLIGIQESLILRIFAVTSFLAVFTYGLSFKSKGKF